MFFLYSCFSNLTSKGQQYRKQLVLLFDTVNHVATFITIYPISMYQLRVTIFHSALT